MLEAVVALLQLIGTILFQYYGWVVVVAILGYLIWQNRRKTKWVEDSEHILLSVEVPKDNEKKELSAEQMFASLHGILRPKSDLNKEGALQEHISFEIASIDNQIRFYIWTPKHLKDFVEGQIYAQYPSVRISEGIEDYSARELGERQVYGTELTLTKDEVLPIKTFPSFEVDPLAGITAVMAGVGDGQGELWIQVLARPIDDSWQQKGLSYIDAIKNGKTLTFWKDLQKNLLALPIHIGANFFHGLVAPPEAPKDKKPDKKELSTGQQAITKAVEEKISKLGYDVKVRIAIVAGGQAAAQQRLQAIVGGFKQFNTVNLNGFTTGGMKSGDDFAQLYRSRHLDQGQILNIEELASVYHLPHKSVETPTMVWVSAKTGEPPANLPTEQNTEPADMSLFGLTNYRGAKAKFGIKRPDRVRHLYIVGQTGTGKSGLLQLLTLSDLYQNQGLAVVDPHGDLANDVMSYVPEHRIDDVVYFNPTDRDFPVAFNPMEVLDPAMKHDAASELVGVMKRMFESWGPRLEHILRFTILALLDYPDATMLGITRMLTEKEFRKKVVKEIQDPVVKAFWVNEFASWNDKFANEAVAPVLNKVGAFIANPLIRNVVGQPKSTINFRKVMDEGKILVVNLSHGQIGEVNAGILGALIVTSIQLAAMSRANVAKEDRRPFYLYVDEFQNFATDSFATILSEARKYNLCLTVANQFIAQMPDTVREAVFGNVGSMITFRTGAGDSSFLAKYYEPVFEAADLVNLSNRNMFISMSINGEKSQPFSGKTLTMPPAEQNQIEAIVEHSRARYAVKREEVEDMIHRATLGGEEQPAGDDSVQQVRTPDEQKPNTFLGGLKNPDQPARSHSSQPRRNENRGDGRNDRNRRPENRDRQDNRSENSPRQQERQGERRVNLTDQQLGIASENEPVAAAPSGEQTVAAGEEVRLR